MKTLLAFIYNHFEFLYLDPRYRFTDSRTSGAATIDATLRLSGPLTSYWLSNDRGQIFCDVAPTKFDSSKSWFRIPIVRQHLDGLDETKPIAAAETAAWVRDNLSRIEALFTDEAVAESCTELSSLEKASADKRFGPAQPPS